MDENLAEIVVSSKIETEFLPGCVKHRFCDPPSLSVNREETWDIREEIGRGGSGVVRKEERRIDSPQDPQLRAVKQMSKLRSNQSTWTYRDELAAVVKFSQPQYAPHFVSTLGWFENDESMFIAMEYLPAGDLENFKNSSPPFSELHTSRIVRQLVEGVRHMHENGFVHRDLKPGNILISSTAPSWQVKIADFGISKQTFQGVTRQQTMNMFGTMGYAAPEALGYHDDSDDTITYTMSVDIWAVGIIALTLLLGRDVFTHQWDFWRYVNQQKPLDFSREQGEELTDTCREFVTRMLAPDPIVRPTVISVLAHPWLKEADTSPPVEVEMHDDQETGRGDGSPPQDAPRIKPEPEPDNTPGMIPETEQQTQLDINLTVVKQEETKPELKLYPPRDPIELQRIHNFLALDSILLSPKFRGILLDQTRYFVLRSVNTTDIETSAAHGVWTASSRVNKRLDKAYRESGGHVVMFFSVTLSRKLCGVARMTSPLDWENTDPHWVEDVWQGRFKLVWHTHTELSFDGIKHVPVRESTPKLRAIACFDGEEISRGSAWELLRAYSSEERVQQRQRG